MGLGAGGGVEGGGGHFLGEYRNPIMLNPKVLYRRIATLAEQDGNDGILITQLISRPTWAHHLFFSETQHQFTKYFHQAVIKIEKALQKKKSINRTGGWSKKVCAGLVIVREMRTM
jgi:hypothetical protein